MRKYNRFLIGFLSAAMVLSLAACGSQTPVESAAVSYNDEAETRDTAAQDAASDRTTEANDVTAELDERKASLMGDWTLISGNTHAGYLEEDDFDDYFYMAEDTDAEIYVSIYDENDALYLDYDNPGGDKMYHMPVTVKNGPLYEDCDNEDWHAEVINPRTGEILQSYTIDSDMHLVSYDSITTEEDENGTWFYSDTQTFFRNDSEEIKNIEDYRYTKTVTVSNVDELVKAVAPRTRIILKEGEYDLTNVDIENNPYFISNRYGYIDGMPEIIMYGITNLALVAEDGADVEIFTTDPYLPVLHIRQSNFIEIEGIKFGHHVEPGHCSGSVLYLADGGNIHINNCHLYGCGTYGIETENINSLNVENTEIFDCTYGAVSMYSSYASVFKNCHIHDCKDMSIFAISMCHGITFDGCQINDNLVDAANFSSPFVSSYESDEIIFTGCSLEHNKYKELTDEDSNIVFEKCNFR